MTQCGYVALLGRPNAGKSTLLNSLLGAKIAAVSAKPQTTRNRILGVFTEGETQVIFLDTPGIHKAEGLPRINRSMNKAAWGVLQDANIVCYLIDVTRGMVNEDEYYLKGILEKCNKPVLILATKIDLLPKEIIRENVADIGQRLTRICEGHTERILWNLPTPCSAKRPTEVETLRKFLLDKMPEEPWLFAADDLTDLPQQFICGELIREQVFRQMGQEIPYGTGVKIESYQVKETRVVIKAAIVVQKESHKGMLLGKGGSRIKSLGTEARLALEKHLGCPVFLELFVKVQEGWIDSERLIAEYASLKDSLKPE